MNTLSDNKSAYECDLLTAIDIITERILTPVLYMFIDDEAVEFVCFCDSKTCEEDFRATELEIYNAVGICCEIVDIRAFDENDRVEIISNHQPVYSADDFVRLIFENAMYNDLHRAEEEKRTMIERKRETGSAYIH